MSRVGAIVFDANVFGKESIPAMNIISTWADACRLHDAELWIPDLVAYELVEHAESKADRLFVDVQAYLKLMGRLGFPAPRIEQTITQELVLQKMKSLGVEVIEVLPEDAKEGLIDQIRVRGMGERRSEVKTGGSDGAWIRSVAGEITERSLDYADVIVVTADKRAADYLMELSDGEASIVANISELRTKLPLSSGAASPVPGGYSERIETEFSAMSLDRLLWLAGISKPDEINWYWRLPSSSQALSNDGYWQDENLRVSSDDFRASVSRISYDPWSSQVVAEVSVNFHANLPQTRYNPILDELRHREIVYPLSFEMTVSSTVDGGEFGEWELGELSPQPVDEDAVDSFDYL